jgi:predicted Zn-ribbon and HTH transcriptional regulator
MMKKGPKEPSFPIERGETVRQEIIRLVTGCEFTAKEISSSVGIREKEVAAHLEHIRKTFHGRFVINPAQCKRCGFIFSKRERLKKPSRCPLCHSESISLPLYSLEEK